MWVGEGQRDNPKQAPLCQQELDVGLELTNHEIMTWPEIKSQTLNWLSHPGNSRMMFWVLGVHLVTERDIEQVSFLLGCNFKGKYLCFLFLFLVFFFFSLPLLNTRLWSFQILGLIISLTFFDCAFSPPKMYFCLLSASLSHECLGREFLSIFWNLSF